MKDFRSWEADYEKRGKSRRKCKGCGRLIQDGERVRIETWKDERYYPVRGIMAFRKYSYFHADCRKEG